MTKRESKELNDRLANGESMKFEDVLNAFFLPEDQDAFARAQGWEDARQMSYYENIAMQGECEQLPPPPSEILIHELQKVDSREVYSEDEACPLHQWYDTSAELEGVY